MNQIMWMEEDKISQLPQHILHHILCFLSQKESVQTSVLSKSWRYLGSTRPKLEFRWCYLKQDHQDPRWYHDQNNTHSSVMDKTLQRYHDQKLSIQQFFVKINLIYWEAFSLLQKWVPIVVTNMGAKTLNLDLRCVGDMNLPSPDFVLPSAAVFKAAEFLEELYLCQCKLTRIEPTDKLLLKRLRKLSLIQVYLEDQTFEKIISSCPLIEYLVLDKCKGLRTIHLNNNNNLKHFEFRPDATNRNCSVEIGHVPSLETIRVDGFPNLFYIRRLCFARLKSLCLKIVHLQSFDIFSSNFPGLEDLTLHNFFGFQELKLSSRSIKRLAIMNRREPIKATIDTPNILYFKYIHHPQSSISFAATCSHEWESHIELYNFLGDADNSDDCGGSSSWLYKIHELLKAFSQSKISVHLSQRFKIPNLEEKVLLDNRGGSSSWLYKIHGLVKAFSQSKIPVHLSQCFKIPNLEEKVPLDNSTYTELVAVEHLTLDTFYSSLCIAAVTKCLLRVFRPRYIVEYHRWLDNDEVRRRHFLAERGKGTQFWPQDMIMVDIDLDEPKWNPVKIGFRLKWKETEMS